MAACGFYVDQMRLKPIETRSLLIIRETLMLFLLFFMLKRL